jgi:formyl-CoA transferase
MTTALEGLRILDLSQYEAGPSCTQALAWMGADVVKVEAIGGGDPGRSLAVGGEYSPYFCNWNANKRSVAIDLMRPEGRALFLELLPRYDVVIENFAPGVIEKFDLSYETLRAVHPPVIFVQIKGFGCHGPYAGYKAYDMVAQAASGAMSATGEMGGRPILPGPTMGDSGTGMQAGMAILAAYVQRLRTGEGQRIEISMQEAMTYYMRTRIALLASWGEQAAPRIGNRMGALPTELYPCRGGGPNDYIYVITVTARHWDALCLAIERPDLISDPRFETGGAREANGPALFEEIASWTRQHEKHEAMKILGAAGVPSSAVLDTHDLYHDPHLLERGFIRTVEHPERGEVSLLGFPTRMSRSQVELERAPYLGEHTNQVLGEDLALDDEAIAKLRESGVLG